MSNAIDEARGDAIGLPLPDGAWRVDPGHSEIGFAAKALGGLMTVRGVFGSYDGHLRVEAGIVSGELRVEAASLETGNERRDRHLRSTDFFAVDRHPRIVFVADEIVARDSGLTVAGELLIGGCRVPLELPIAVERVDGDDLRLEGAASVSRKAAGITWNWLGTVGDVVVVHARLALEH